MNLLWIAIAALGGGITSSLLGWLDSKEHFDPRKFLASVVRSLIATALFASGYALINGVTPMDIIVAFCGGAGVDVIGKTGQSLIKK